MESFRNMAMMQVQDHSQINVDKSFKILEIAVSADLAFLKLIVFNRGPRKLVGDCKKITEVILDNFHRL
jgi:hypothetical protein